MIHDEDKVKRGTVCVHKNGNVYTILNVKGFKSKSYERTHVKYIGANGKEWERPIDEFMESFSIIFDGTNKYGTQT